MPESERDLLIECLPLGASNEEWAALVDKFLGRAPNCPPVVQLLQMSRGQLPPEQAGPLQEHARSCPYCGLWAPKAQSDSEVRFAASLDRFHELAAALRREEEGQPGAWEEEPLPAGVPADQQEQYERLLDLAEYLEPGKDETHLLQPELFPWGRPSTGRRGWQEEYSPKRVHWPLEAVTGLIADCLVGAGVDPHAFSSLVVGADLLDHLAGPDAVLTFKAMHRELMSFRERVATGSLQPVDRLILRHHPEMEGTTWGLSHRRFFARRFDAWLVANGATDACVTDAVQEKLIELVREAHRAPGDPVPVPLGPSIKASLSVQASLGSVARKRNTTFVLEAMQRVPVVPETFRRIDIDTRPELLKEFVSFLREVDVSSRGPSWAEVRASEISTFFAARGVAVHIDAKEIDQILEQCLVQEDMQAGGTEPEGWVREQARRAGVTSVDEYANLEPPEGCPDPLAFTAARGLLTTRLYKQVVAVKNRLNQPGQG